MQAPSKSRASAVAVSESLPTLVRMLVALLATVTLLFLFRPTVVHAQEPVKPAAAKPADAKPTAHAAPAAPVPAHAAAPAHSAPPNSAVHAPVTTTGSAQGALAEQTVGKSDAAPKEPVKAAPRSVRPAVAKAVVSSAPAEKRKAAAKEAAHAAPADEVASDAFANANSDPVSTELPRIWGPDGMAMRGARGAEQPTVFISHALDAHQADVEVDALLPVKVARPRTAEYASAPFAVSTATLTSAGVVGHQEAPVKKGFVARLTSAAMTKAEPTPRRLQLLDEVEVSLPAGSAAEIGRRFVTVDANRLFKSTTLIVVPTGVLEVTRVEDGVVFARVMSLTGAVQEGQRLVAIEGGAILSGAQVTAVPRLSNAPETEVIWVDSDGLLPSLQSYLVLGAGQEQGVKIGDQFALVKRFGLGPDAVERRIATVRVVRVTAFGSSAIVVRQDEPGIGVGSAARLVGRVP